MIDAEDEMAIADAILKVIGDRIFRQELITKGYEQALKFSWRRTAQETLIGYRQLITHHNPI